MAGKLTIRRVGTFFPLACLVGLLVVVAVILWLSTAGIPGCALRYIEAEAAKAGIPVKIEKIQLVPRAGLVLKAERLSLDIPQPEAPPATLRLRKAQLAFSLNRFLRGDMTPLDLKLRGGHIEIPTGNDTSNTIRLSHIMANADILPEARGINVTIKTELNGITLSTHAALSLQELLPKDKDKTPQKQILTPEELGSKLALIRPQLQKAITLLNQQNWSDGQRPTLKLKVLGGKVWKYQLTAWIPDFHVEYLHVRDASVEVSFENNTFTISTLKLHTINPDTAISLQGAYDTTTRELEFNTQSTAPIVSLIDSYLGDASIPVLKEIHNKSDNTPIIELNGSAAFAENYALNRITLRGRLEHREFQIGETDINHLLLTFFVRDGSFNIDNIVLELPEGHIRASAKAENGAGSAKVDINLSDETILALTRDISNTPGLALPEALTFGHNLQLRASCEVATPVFEPGKTRIEDLIPTLKSCTAQFNTGHIGWGATHLHTASFSLLLDDIHYNSNSISIGTLELKGLAANAQNKEQEASAKKLVYDISLEALNAEGNTHVLSIGKAAASLSLESAQHKTSAVNKLHITTELADFYTNWKENLNSLRSSKILTKLHANSLAHDGICASGIMADITIPEGLKLTDGWQNMQKDAEVQTLVDELRYNNEFCMTGTQILVRNTGNDECSLTIGSKIGAEQLEVSCTAALEQSKILHITNLQAQLPMASLAPLMGGEPLKELKLPRLLTLQANAFFDTETNHLIQANYDIHLPELVRVCHNVHVHKGMEIPLELQVKGDFSTAENGSMHYDADILARHKTGVLDIHVTGDPLKECRITGSNTITVDVINALIDNVDAHWIMRDFRCTPGVTRHNITDINTTIRYDKGIYVHALCKAHLQNLEFLLGIIRDKHDSKGKETGEEYMRTDLGKEPYTLVREGRCDVEVLVQLDCTDEAGNPLPERIRINLTNPDLLYDNKPWLKRNKFKKGALTSRIKGEAVRFNIENNTISLHNLKGNCYPAYSIGMYYAPIQHFLEDIILRDPVDIATDYCIFPLSRNCDVPMRGLIQTHGATGAGFRFLGTTIPLADFTGFINISDTDVYLDQMNAQSWGGVISGALRIGFSGRHTTLDGYLEAKNLNLKDIVASYGEDFTPATCNGFIRFQSARPELEDVIAYGEVSLKDGNLMQLSLFRPVASLLSDMPGHLAKLQKSVNPTAEQHEPNWFDRFIRGIFDTGSSTIDSAYNVPFANHFLRYGIDEAFTRFDIRDGHLITRDMKAKGYNLNIKTQLDIDLDKLTLQGDLWPEISSVPTLLISPITILSDFLIDINIYGDMLNPQWEFGLSKKLEGDKASLTPEPQKKESKP